MVKSKFKFKHIFWIISQCLYFMIFEGILGYILFDYLRDFDREAILITSSITGLCVFLTAKYFPTIFEIVFLGSCIGFIILICQNDNHKELTILCLFLIIVSLLILFAKKLIKLFIKVKVEYDSIYIFTLLSPFKPIIYSIDDYNGYFLTEESIKMGGRQNYDYTFKVAWLSCDNTLMVRIPDFYRNFNEILAATNLKYKRQIEPKEYKSDDILSFDDGLSK